MTAARFASTAVGALLTTAVAVLTAAPFLGHVWDQADFVAAAVPVVPALAFIALVLWRRSRVLAAVNVVTLIVSIGLIWGELPPPAPGRALPTLTIVTHNVWVDNRHPEATVTALARSGADILLLQETEGSVWPYLARLRAAYPYASECRNRCSLAIFSRYPIDRVRYRFRDGGDRPFGPPLVQTIVHPGHGMPDVRLVSVHLGRSRPAVLRAADRRSLADVATIVTHPEGLIVGGDFNLVPWSTGMRDLDTAIAPLRRATRALPTYPSPRGEFHLPFAVAPIDHVFVGAGWSIERATTLPPTGSDHLPVSVRLGWKGR